MTSCFKIFFLYFNIKLSVVLWKSDVFLLFPLLCPCHHILLVFVRQTGLAWPPSAAHYRASDRANYWWQWALHNITSHTHRAGWKWIWRTFTHTHTEEIPLISGTKSKLCTHAESECLTVFICLLWLIVKVCVCVCSGVRNRTFLHTEVIVPGARSFNKHV